MKIENLIERITAAMKARGYCFNGVQIYDHLRVIEVCAGTSRYAVIEMPDRKWFDEFDADGEDTISKIIAIFDDYAEIDRDYAVAFGRLPVSKKTGVPLSKDRYVGWLLSDFAYRERSSEHLAEVQRDVDKVYEAQAA